MIAVAGVIAGGVPFWAMPGSQSKQRSTPT
jgi:hypothetical protein